MDFDDIFEEYDDGPPFKFKVDVTNDCYMKASSKANFAVQLVRRCYSRTERSTSNCSGDHRYRKRKLSPNRMEAVKRPLLQFTQSSQEKAERMPGSSIR